MPKYQFEAMDPQGQEIKDVIDAATQDEAQATIRSMGYFVIRRLHSVVLAARKW